MKKKMLTIEMQVHAFEQKNIVTSSLGIAENDHDNDEADAPTRTYGKNNDIRFRN